MPLRPEGFDHVSEGDETAVVSALPPTAARSRVGDVQPATAEGLAGDVPVRESVENVIERKEHHRFCLVTMYGTTHQCSCAGVESAVLAERSRIQDELGRAIWQDRVKPMTDEPRGLGAVVVAHTSVMPIRRAIYRDHRGHWIEPMRGAIRDWEDLIDPEGRTEGWMRD